MEKTWLTEAPSCDDLVDEVADGRLPRKSRTAIIIPSYADQQTLARHLKALGNQTVSDFDVVVIYGNKDSFVNIDRKLSVLHIRQRTNIGCAGSFYLGQRICLEEGYQNLIFADDDCIPLSEDLVEMLVRSLGKSWMARPRIKTDSEDKLSRGVIHHYGSVRSECLKRSGLTYLPFFLGGEEFDLMRRLRKEGFGYEEIESIASHRSWPPLFIWEMDKIQAYSMGNILQLIIARDLLRSWISMSIHLQSAVGLMLIGKQDQTSRYLASAWRTSDCDFSRNWLSGPRVVPIALPCEASSFKEDNILKRSDSGGMDPEIEAFIQFEGKNPIANLLGRALEMIREKDRILASMNRNVLFDGWCNIRDFPYILLSKGSAIRFEGGTYVINRDRGLIEILLSCFCFLALLPLSVGLGFILSIRGIANAKIGRIKSEGYGLPLNVRSTTGK